MPGWPIAPAVLSAGKPTLGLPVVTNGVGIGPFFTHQSKYSARIHIPGTGIALSGFTSTCGPSGEGANPGGSIGI